MDSTCNDNALLAVKFTRVGVTLDIQEVLDKWRPEIQGYLQEMQGFEKIKNPQEIIPRLSAMSARVSTFRNAVIRSDNSKMMRFRIDEIDPFLGEIKNQFSYWSRYQSGIKDDWEMSKGGF